MIYGVTGGVAEAVVRHCLPDKSKNTLRAVRVTDLRGDGAIRHRGSAKEILPQILADTLGSCPVLTNGGETK